MGRGDAPGDLKAARVCVSAQRHARDGCHVVLLLHERAPLHLVVPRDHQRGGGGVLAGRRAVFRFIPGKRAVPPDPHLVNADLDDIRPLAAGPRLRLEQGVGHPGWVLLPGRVCDSFGAGVDQHNADPGAGSAPLPPRDGSDHVRCHHVRLQLGRGLGDAVRGSADVAAGHHRRQPRKLLDPCPHLQRLHGNPAVVDRVGAGQRGRGRRRNERVRRQGPAKGPRRVSRCSWRR
mmetsp:Transcript_42618/g.101435  ORF Transcript_42618/g.101435 Transcript_42618/m.101435 type:complete len:233 (+) Transcript_42618:801-1499(+)